MKPCPTCGGAMRRHSSSLVKSTGETKLRLRCSRCGSWESHYTTTPTTAAPPVVKVEKRRGGRPGINDDHRFSTHSPHESVIA